MRDRIVDLDTVSPADVPYTRQALFDRYGGRTGRTGRTETVG